MKVRSASIEGLLLVEPRVFADARGRFHETWAEARYREAGIPGPFVQDNLSHSGRGVVRGLHFQQPHAQGKLVSVPFGRVWDVAVDLRPGSPTFRRWEAFELSDEDARQLWIPPGFAHGFQVLSERAIFSYKCTEAYHPESERTVRWNDPALGIAWPLADAVLSPKDAAAPLLADLPAESLPG